MVSYRVSTRHLDYSGADLEVFHPTQATSCINGGLGVKLGILTPTPSVLAAATSRVCAVAQYAVLEANGKVNGIGEISHPSPSQTLGPIWMPLQYITTSPGSRCAKFD